MVTFGGEDIRVCRLGSRSRFDHLRLWKDDAICCSTASWLVNVLRHPLVVQGIRCPVEWQWSAKAEAMANDFSHMGQETVILNKIEDISNGVMIIYFS